MLPSSRTPEGEPVACPVCGKLSIMDYSIPPGDVACPHCGSLVWRQKSVRSYGQTKQRIQMIVAEIAALSRPRDTMQMLRTNVLSEMVTCLGAYAGIVWVIGGQTGKPFSLRTLCAECQVDRSTTDAKQVDLFQASDFVWSVVDEKTPLHLATAIGPLLITRLAVPVISDGYCTRVIEILHQPDVQPSVRDNYLEFMREVGQMMAELPNVSA